MFQGIGQPRGNSWCDKVELVNCALNYSTFNCLINPMDPISDMLTRIRNAVLVRHGDVLIPFSRIKFEIAKIMESEKFVNGVEVLEKERQLKISLRYGEGGLPVIRSLKRISKPGKRVYASKEELPKVLGGMGVAIVSTSSGLLTAGEAKKRGLGGEVLCEIY